MMDYSNYPPSHPFYSKDKRLMPGQWKEEWGGAVLDSFVGLKPKMYSLHLAHYPVDRAECEVVSGKQAAKGVPRGVKEKQLTHAAYLKTIKKHKKMTVSYYKLQRKRMEINLIQETRAGLNYFNDKKFVKSTTKPNHSFGFNPL